MGKAVETARQARLVELRHYLAEAEGFGKEAARLSFGLPAIDEALIQTTHARI